MTPEQFDRLDRAVKKLGLSNADFACLLQVTPAMVSRYRKQGGVAKIGIRDQLMYPRAAKAIKEIATTNSHDELRSLKPNDRMGVVVAALKATNTAGDELRLPVIY